jgi:microcystin-dependent protein
MTDQYVGEIRNFGFNYAPRGWAPCCGQVLSISGNEALYSLLGNRFGGDGRVTFALPDLRGRVSINQGNAQHLSRYDIGEKGGTEFVSLQAENLPEHNHILNATTAEADTDAPAGGVLANARSNLYFSPQTNTVENLANGTISAVGENSPLENRQPFLVTNFCIALTGEFPKRP